MSSYAPRSLVSARVKPEIKDRATSVLRRMGLTPTEVVRQLMTRVAEEGKLPFEVEHVAEPSETTQQAIAELESGGGKSFASVKDLWADLND